MSDITLTEFIEPLEKKCPRCGGASANKSNPSGRCSACLKKLASNKKKPGHWQRAQTKADDALRRQKGKNGTAHKKSKGLGSRASIVKQTQSAEKKTGEKLSPDRKNNGEGYAASNTRMVPEKLNRGRHHVDPKKLRAWKKRMKKSDVDYEALYTLMKARVGDDEELLAKLKTLGPDGLEHYINLLDIDQSEETDLKKNISEPLAKEAAQKLPEPEPSSDILMPHVGKVHTVEIHPDIDHLYRAKGLIKENNRPHLHIGDFKRANFPSDIIKKLPRDANGKVTEEMIDEHIASLPKKKVNIELQPYTWGAQQHRSHRGQGQQYVAKVLLHPEHHDGAEGGVKELWDEIKNDQHILGEGDKNNSSNQIGWARLDPYKASSQENRKVLFSPHNHLHVDEIQSDFQHEDKVKKKYGLRDGFPSPGEDPEADAKFNNRLKLGDENTSKLIDHLSHDHEDPQHAIHSAVNALGRKLGVKSISMDTPRDQAKQSGLLQGGNNIDNSIEEAMNEHHPHHWEGQVEGLKNGSHPSLRNPYFKSAMDKIGGIDALTEIAEGTAGTGNSVDLPNNIFGIEDKPHLEEKINSLSEPESHALHEMMQQHYDTVYRSAEDGNFIDDIADDQELEVPVHQMNTYNKRPRKLGMKVVPKSDVLGEDPNDSAKEVQYMNLHKKFKQLEKYLEQLKKTKK